MIKLYLSLSVLLVVIFLPSCYVSKTLERDVNVSLNTDFVVSVTNNGSSTFSSKYSEEEYKAAFIEGMKAEFAGGHIKIVESNPEFTVTVSEVSMVESTKTETVADEDSEDNGKVFELSSLNLSAKGQVVKVAGSDSRDWWADKSKDEKVTNSRSGGQIITGDNKDNNTYREKDFNDDVALDLARKCGRRSGARITNDIVKALK